MSPRLRTALVAVVGLSAAGFVAARVVNSRAFLNPRDFLEYWAAGAANAPGANPYAAAELLPLQRAADPGRDAAVMMWNPPWALAAYMPFGLLPPRWATLLWVGLQLAAVMLACDWLWRAGGGPPRARWVAQLVGLSFAPVVWTVLYGQNTGLLVLGLAGFAHFRRAGRPAAAGAFAALTALKPHLLAVFGVLLVADAVAARGRVALAAGGATLLAALAVAAAANPAVLSQYRDAVRHPGPDAVGLDQWALPAASYWLRAAAGAGFWVQFVPCAVACVGYVARRVRLGTRWDWAAEMPAVVWVSVLVTPYGGWVFDLTVLLVPLVPAAARVVAARRWVAGGVLLAGHAAITAASLAWAGSLPGFFWVAPAVLLLHLAARPRGEPRSAPRSLP